MNYTLYIIIIILCLLFSAFFSATETAFSSLNKIRMRTMADKGNKRAKAVLKLSDKFDKLLTTILIGNNIVNILAATICTLIFVDLIGQSVGSTVSTVVLTIIVLIFGEITPKTIAKEVPEKFAMFATPIINGIMILFTPFTFVFSLWKKLLCKIFKFKGNQAITEEELISIVEEAEEDGGLDKQESDLIVSAIEFSELEIGDIYVPRIDVVAIDIDSTYDEITDIFVKTGYSRIPVYRDNLDNIIGILHCKDYFRLCKTENMKIEDILKPASYVAKTQEVNEVLKFFQKNQIHFAIVSDEFGFNAGIVTMEDILEEIVGDIWDEYDKKIEEIKQTGEKKYIASGKANVQKLFDMLDFEEQTDVVSVNGWVMDNLKCIPTENMEFEDGGLNVKVLSVCKRRVEYVEIVDNRPPEEDDE